MLEQAGIEIIWYAHFTSAGTGKTGLAPSITIYKDDSDTPEVNLQVMDELADGFYYYKQTPSGEGFRVAVAKTADTAVDQKHLPAVMLIGKAGIEHLDANVSSRSSHDDPDPNGYLDAAVSSRSAASTTATEATLEQIRDAVDNVATRRETQEL